MLESLHVKNLALIKENEVFFYPGLNILSGETGAGKSIILGSIRLALGAKAGKDFIRNGEEYALIELIFRSSKAEVVQKLREQELPVEEDGTIFIQRKIMEGRSSAKINGETVSSKGLRQIASLLINIHGQNDTTELLDSKNYLDILDEYAGSDVITAKEQLAEEYHNYIALKKELDDSHSLDKNRDRELSLAEFEYSEIENAKLAVGEDDMLENRYRLMNNSKKIVDGIGKAYSAVDSDQGAASSLDYALREIRSVMRFDEELAELENSIATACDIVADCKRSMSDYMADMEFSEAEFIEVENRLDIVNHLKSKYGNSIEEVLQYAEDRKTFIEKMSDFSTYLTDLELRVHKARKKLLDGCRELSEIRSAKADVLSRELERNLKELNLSNARCEVTLESGEDKLSESGYDSVDFLVSFNIGEPVKSLSLVASGGELSRFMLALKAITADKEQIDTLIFDEIDSGISGKTAWNVAEKMNVIGLDHQVIAITHLPQIAAMADSHYMIEKSSSNDSTETSIYKLNEDESIHEIARLMSTNSVSDTILESAKELKAQSKLAKQR